MVKTAHPGNFSLYGYVPTEWISALFITFFGLSTITHFVQAIYFRLWWLLPTAILAGTAEVIGWAARLWSSKNPHSLNAYLMQICTTIIAPTPLVAANFIILGELIKRLGTQYSRLKPSWYAIVFCSADVVALVVQAIGGAQASIAVENGRSAESGGHIMLAGIAIQMVAIIIYAGLASEFLYRISFQRPISGRVLATTSPADSMIDAKEDTSTPRTRPRLEKNYKLMLVSLSFSTLCIFIRAIYRTIELANGFTGRIIHTQVLFNTLDGMMIVLAMLCLNFLHPGWLLFRRGVKQ